MKPETELSWQRRAELSERAHAIDVDVLKAIARVLYGPEEAWPLAWQTPMPWIVEELKRQAGPGGEGDEMRKLRQAATNLWDTLSLCAYRAETALGPLGAPRDDLRFVVRTAKKTLEEWRPTQPPPLGLMPEHIWNEQRLVDIRDAMKRYRQAGMQVPQDWVVEHDRLTQIARR